MTEENSKKVVVSFEEDNVEPEVTINESDVPEVTVDEVVKQKEVVQPSDNEDEEVEKKRRVSRAQKRIKQLNADKQRWMQEAMSSKEELESLRKEYASSKVNTKATLEEKISLLTKQLTAAVQNGDAEGIVSLQSDLITARMELAGLTSEIHRQEKAEPQKVTQQTNEIPQKALDWVEEYPAFNQDPIFRASAIAVNNILISEGYDVDSDDFYDELNSRLKPKFPEVFGMTNKNSVQYSQASKNVGGENMVEDDKESTESKPKKKVSTEQVVSGASRATPSTANSRKSTTVELTEFDVAEADRLGISLEQMARRIKHSQENRESDGYVPIKIPQR